MSSTILIATLKPHPASPSSAVQTVRARLERGAGGRLTISYTLEGEMSRVNVPNARSPRFVDGLWKHTCCECFLAIEEEPAYHELNFSPSGEWAMYSFSSYRGDARPLNHEALTAKIAVRQSADRLELDASIELANLAASYRDSALRVGLSAVIEHPDDTFSYWALAHPGPKPDFHHRGGFARRLRVTDGR